MFLCFCFSSFGCQRKKEYHTGKEVSYTSNEKEDSAKILELAKKYFQPIPQKAPQSEKDSKEKIALGKELYFDKRLSVNNTISCNSCHQLNNGKAGVDNEPTSPGAFGKRGDRNSPTVFNAAFHIAQFWDGRAKDLVEQAKGPILNPIEMAMPSEAEVIKKLKAIKDYQKKFQKAFPKEKDPLTYQNIAEAIAAFERTLITRDRLDDFLEGDLKALNQEELKGLQSFVKTGCTTCHSGPLLGGNMFQKMGLVHPYENRKDLGRFKVTKNPGEKYFFKVPSLRNVALTAPYFHDGSVKTLEQAVVKMAWLQLGKKLTSQEIKNIVAFLKALTGKRFLKK
ncbi:MAG: cytochrome-c peroxidase [Planctomycetota bacterium]|nr:MAG: cytochrome-c peroxidase [Planctomycetota bacterium]